MRQRKNVDEVYVFSPKSPRKPPPSGVGRNRRVRRIVHKKIFSLKFYFSLNLHHKLYYNLEKKGGEKQHGSNFEIEIINGSKGK